jgi:asparagine synthase (glutamine-hydrolysing)
MASSVELRLPFADHRLVETVVGLRKARSDSALQPKAWLKAAVRDLVPGEILDRPKRGFAPPTHEWHAALFARYGDTLRGGLLENDGVLSAHGAEMLAAGPFPAGAITPISFKALVLEQWCRQMCGLAA